MGESNKVKRRFFIGASLVATGAVIANPVKSIAKNNLLPIPVGSGDRVYISESGVFGKDPLFVIGVLTINGTSDKHEKNLDAIRKKHNYKTQLTYRSNDRFKEPFAKEVIDYFINEQELYFSVQVLHEPNTISNHDTKNALIKKKLKIFKGIAGSVSQDNIIVKYQLPFVPSTYFKKKFEIKTNKKLKSLYSESSNLLQLADLVTGCIRGDISGSAANLQKVSIIQHLKDKLGTDHLGVGFHAPQKMKIVNIQVSK